MAATHRIYGGLTTEERRAQRREKLLAAGLEVFATKGWAGATVLDICRHAQLSQRYFYEAFAGRDELFEALLDDIGAEAASLIADVFPQAPGTPRDRVRSVVAGIVDYFLDDPRRTKVSLVESLAAPEFRERRRRSLAYFAQLGHDELRKAPGLRAGRSLELTASVMAGGMAELLVAATTGGPVVSRAELVDHLTEMWICAATAG